MELVEIILKFIWKNKCLRIGKKILEKMISKGGLLPADMSVL